MKIDPAAFDLDPSVFFDTTQPKAAFRADSHICVDSTPPTIDFAPAVEHRTQGDKNYDHESPTFKDNNNDVHIPRTIKGVIPPELLGLSGHLETVGTFTLEYTMVTPWLPPDAGQRVKAARDVIISDVDECSYAGGHGPFVHQCFKTVGGAVVGQGGPSRPLEFAA